MIVTPQSMHFEAPLALQSGASVRTAAPALMRELIPLLHKLAQGREIPGLKAYEQ